MTRIVRRLVLAALVAGGAVAGAQPASQLDLPNIRQLGAALAEYQDLAVHAVAAYYYSQRNHDSAWLLVEIGVTGPASLTIRRTEIALVTPSGVPVPLATQERWGGDTTRGRLLLQQARPTRHQLRTYFPGLRGSETLRFFGRPEVGDTVIDAVESAPDQLIHGDLLFESPTGAWSRGRHVLLVGLDDGPVRLPIDLR